MQRLRIKRTITRAAMMLLTVVLTMTAQTAWADIETLTVGDYTFTTGSDADGDYYVVDSKEALTAIANYVNANSEYNCSGMRFKQTADITLSGTWTPIGKIEKNKSYQFKGTYDGRGYNISGLSTNLNERSGLFGIIGSGGVVKNVNVVNCSVGGDNVWAALLAKAVALSTTAPSAVPSGLTYLKRKSISEVSADTHTPVEQSGIAPTLPPSKILPLNQARIPAA